jgi:DNA-directed RNA polymerase
MHEDAETTAPIGRDESGRFAVGNPGRPKGARHKLGEQFLAALQADFEEHGASTIELVRIDRPQDYIKVIASLLPRDLNLNVNNLGEATDDELVQRLRDLESVIRPFLAAEGGGGDRAGDRPATAH